MLNLKPGSKQTVHVVIMDRIGRPRHLFLRVGKGDQQANRPWFGLFAKLVHIGVSP